MEHMYLKYPKTLIVQAGQAMQYLVDEMRLFWTKKSSVHSHNNISGVHLSRDAQEEN